MSLASKMDPMKFEVLSRLGSGAYAQVYKERYAPDGALYAVKVLADCHGRDPQTLAALETAQREARILTMCDHPNIIRYYATLQRTNGERMYVLELCDGGDLRTVLARKRTLPIDVCRYIGWEVAVALLYLHEGEKKVQPALPDGPRKPLRVLHRDLKPENVVLTSRRHAKLVDFGTVSNPGDTANTFVGTAEYMAPEVHNSIPATGAADWWSFGVTLYELLCGRRPFTAPSQYEVLELILNENPPFPRGAFEPDAEDLLRRLLQKDPEARLQGGDVLKHPFFQPWIARLEAEGALASYGRWLEVDVAAYWVRNATWAEDDAVKTCPVCDETNFGLLQRRHHCRMCGRVVCSKCSGKLCLIPDSTYTAKERVCDPCFAILAAT